MNRSVVIVLAVAAACPASASIRFVGSHDLLDPNGRYDLTEAGQPGSQYPLGITLLIRGNYGPAAFTGNLSGSGAVERQDQGDTWHGDFASGDALAWTARNSTYLTFRPSKPVGGAGTNVGAFAPGAYVARIEALGQGDAVLATFTRAGFNDGLGLGQAPYLAVASEGIDIRAIRLSLVGGGDLAVSSVDVRTNPVPEPQLWAAAALAGGWWLRRRVVS